MSISMSSRRACSLTATRASCSVVPQRCMSSLRSIAQSQPLRTCSLVSNATQQSLQQTRSNSLSSAFVRSFSVKVGSKRYTPDHEYVHLTAANAATIGISNHAQEALGDVVFVDLPDVGAEFKQKEAFGSVESVKAASSVYAPIDLKITATNEELTSNCSLINESAEEKGWMIKADIADVKQLEKLMDEAAYAKFVEEEAAKH